MVNEKSCPCQSSQTSDLLVSRDFFPGRPVKTNQCLHGKNSWLTPRITLPLNRVTPHKGHQVLGANITIFHVDGLHLFMKNCMKKGWLGMESDPPYHINRPIDNSISTKRVENVENLDVWGCCLFLGEMINQSAFYHSRQHSAMHAVHSCILLIIGFLIIIITIIVNIIS